MKSRHETKEGLNSAENRGTMLKDPVCGMDVDSKKAVSSDIGGKKQYFCSEDCRDKYSQQQGQGKTSSGSREHSRT